jgi:perosamine synthetase
MSSDLIPLCEPNIAGAEWRYVKDCLDTGWVSSAGAYVSRFEREFAQRIGSPHGVAAASGTAALHLALLAAGVETGDEVLVPPLTFIAPANAIRYVGAHPVFIGIDGRYWQMDPERLESFLADSARMNDGRLVNRRSGRRIAAVVPVHVLGHPCDIGAIVSIADRYALPVIEDATESLGARYEGRAPGTFGLAGCFSFNGNKLITTGGGGMLVSADERVAARAKYLSTQAKDSEEYVHGDIGYNYRLTNLQSALGVAQLEQLSGFLAAKRRIAETYTGRLGQMPGITPMAEAPWATSSWWMYTVLVERERYGMDCVGLRNVLAAAGIQTRLLWQPLHRSKPHLACEHFACEEADRVYGLGLSLPCSTGLNQAQQERVIATIEGARRA